MSHYIILTAKSSDKNNIQIYDDAVLAFDHEGYVLPDLGLGKGDYIELVVDVNTGKILGWDSYKVKQTIKKLLIDEN